MVITTLPKFEPDFSLDFVELPKTRMIVNLEDHITPHCGVCKARSKLLRLHPVNIHTDLESLDFQDDPQQWNVIHEEERYNG